ncbi:aromatic ring hydroxylase [Peribacillus frigoritolerans]|nr:aromatic ring hydroxylase [Peribacillus frigoritolerans]
MFKKKIGELLIQVETIRALLIASEREGKLDQYQTFIPNFNYIETARNLGTVYNLQSLNSLI